MKLLSHRKWAAVPCYNERDPMFISSAAENCTGVLSLWNLLALWRLLWVATWKHRPTQAVVTDFLAFWILVGFPWKSWYIYLLVPASQSCLVGMRLASKFMSANASALGPRMPFLSPFPGPLVPTLPFSVLHNLRMISLKPTCIFVDNTFIMIISVSPVLFQIWNHVLHLVERNPTDNLFRERHTHICISVSTMFFEETLQDIGRVLNSGIACQPIKESF